MVLPKTNREENRCNGSIKAASFLEAAEEMPPGYCSSLLLLTGLRPEEYERYSSWTSTAPS